MKEDIKIDLGIEILCGRIERNLTQKQLAKMIGTKQPSIARVERGAVMPSIGFLLKVAKALGMSLVPPKLDKSTTHTVYGSLRV